jgi:PAS domain S-box-containing protein
MGKERGIYKFPLHLIIIFIVLAIGIGVSGYLYYEKEKEYIKKAKQNELTAIEDLKVKQIVNWRKERLGDAAIFSESPFISYHVRQFLENPNDTKIKQEILTWIKTFQQVYQYQNIILIDAHEDIRLSVSAKREVLGPTAKRLVEQAMQIKKVIFSDFYRSKVTGDVHIGIFTPIINPQGQDFPPIGVFFFRIDPNQFLYPLIQKWPTPSKTAETLLVRHEGNEIVFLNELKHKKNIALNLRFPISNEKLPASMAARGITGIVEGIDYRGVPVIAAIQKIPDTNWFLITKVDRDEIFSILYKRVWFISIIIISLITAAGLGIGFIWRQQNAEFYRKQYETKHERQLYLQRYEYLTKYANDIILLMDSNLKIVEANERAFASYGYSREELLQLNIRDLQVPEARSALDAQIKQVVEQNGFVYESAHLCKDGTIIPVEVSSRVIEVEGKRFFQSIIRNIAERKQADEKIRHLNVVLRAIRNVNQFITREYDRDQLLQVACKSFVETRGYRSAWIALLDESGKLITSAEAGVGEHFSSIVKQLEQGDLPQCDLKALRESGVVVFDENRAECHQCPLADVYPGSSSMTARLEYGGKIYGFITVSVPLALTIDEEEINLFREVSDDIAFALHNLDVQADKKKAEEALWESEQRFKAIFDNAADGILLADMENKKFYSGNRMICQMLGYSQKEIKNLGVMDIHPKKDIPYVLEQFEKQASGEITLAYDIPVKRKDRSVFYADINSFSITLAGKTYMVGIFRDTTERRQAEEVLKQSEKKYRVLIENLPQKIFLKDRNSVYVSCNENYARDLKIRSDEITGKTDYDFYPKELAEKYRAADQKIVEVGNIEAVDEKYLQNAHEVWVHTVKTPVKDGKGNIVGILGIFWDISEHKKMEDELKKRVKELEDFYEIGVGRELRMIELKKEIENLKDELAKYKKT